MIYQQVSDTQNYQFELFWNSYTSSFIAEERRDKEKQGEVLKDSRYKLLTVWEGEKYIGFISYWHLEGCVFIEHFAISSALRGGGYGSRILEHMLNKYKDETVILEVEPMEDKIKEARVRFYQKMGFVFNEYKYYRPYYLDSKTDQLLQLYVVSSEERLTREEFETISSTIHREIYNREI